MPTTLLYQPCDCCLGTGVRCDLDWTEAPKCPGCGGARFYPVGLSIDQVDRLNAAAEVLALAAERARLHLSLPHPEDEPDERAEVLADLVAALTRGRQLLLRGRARPAAQSPGRGS